MAHFLRKVAIIGLIAMNSPVHGGKPDDADPVQAVRQVASAVAASAISAEPRAASGNVIAAREAAQILAGLDPEMRARILSAAASTATSRAILR